MIFADIIVDISHEDLDRSFQYIIPKELEEKIYVGVLVKIPFGRGNRIISGYVVGITKKPAWEISKMKKILEIEEQKVPVETELIALAGFIRENYGATMNQALKTVIPVRQKTKAVENKMILLAEDYKDSEKFSELLALYEKKHALARLRLLKEFLQKKELDYSYVVNILKVSAASVKELEKQGVIKVDRQTVYRNPLTFLEDFDRQPAVETELELNEEQKKIVEADVSFVGSLYTEKHTLYDRMEKLDERTRGYLEGVMASQMLVYGYTFVEDTLSPDIIENMQKAMPLDTNMGGMETPGYTYANYFLCRKITQTERTEILDGISRLLKDITVTGKRPAMPLKLYTPEPTPFLPAVKNMGTVHYMYEMPLVFQNSRINLNITLRSIRNGIPLRAMDIMGAGGFLLTNYQNDFDRHFTDGEDFVSYTSREDLYNKIQYYLEHDGERREIAENGCKRVREGHTYEKRLEEMLGTVNPH